ncbi:hypothetical protein QUF61_06515 [Candidatus Venteria ishoeyi]|uniref:hypothetical protein n=1 Tax=Candidatus Venteria ishoeyi TaxID=1899563 RepID=UPI0025A51455|nr:hypothetical protein [Candidatus Venteria ishoeyi]MDM8546130.1 hypothetical protein [Candidatus Venteria ishoeyi]
MFYSAKPVSVLARSLSFALLLSAAAVAQAGEKLKPYVLGSQGAGEVAAKAAEVKTALTDQGFEIAAQYSPYAGTEILVVSNDATKKNAALSDFGGYGVAQRVAVSKADAQVQVSYTNPVWMANAYRMQGDMQDVAGKLKAALGASQAFGSEDGKNADDLREYHYMMMMPYFDDQVELAAYGSYEAAVKAVDAGLSAGKGGTKKVFRIDIPGKKETLFGAAISKGEGADAGIMKIIDTGKLKHAAHLPYDVLVTADGKVYMLHGKFRIAQSFPDLGMGSFMEISGAPDAIEEALSAAVSK